MKGNSAVLLILKGQIFRKVKKTNKKLCLVCPVSCMSSSDKGDNNKKNKLSQSSTDIFSIYHHIYKDRRGFPRMKQTFKPMLVYSQGHTCPPHY